MMRFLPVHYSQSYICNAGSCQYLSGTGETGIFGEAKGRIVKLNLSMCLDSVWI